MSSYVTAEAKEFHRALKITNSIIERRNTIPILSYVRITRDKKGLRISGTDLDMQVTVQMDTMDYSAKTLDICINAAHLNRIARVGKSMPMRVYDDGKIDLGNGYAIYESYTLPAEDMPKLHGGERKGLLEVFSNGSLSDLLAKVAWAAGVEETRYYLQGVFWQISPKGSFTTATNGHVMASCNYSKEAGDDGINGRGRIIPNKAVGFIMTQLKARDLQVYATENDLVMEVTSHGITFRTKLIDGTFPDYPRVIHTSYDHEFHMRKEDFGGHVNMVSAVKQRGSQCVIMDEHQGKMIVSLRNMEEGKAVTETNIKWADGMKPFSFNSEYLRMVMATITGDMALRCTDPMAPMIFHDEDETMTRILMPMRH